MAIIVLKFTPIQNPILDLEQNHPPISTRDPALVYANDRLYCFYSAVEYRFFRYTFFLDMISTTDLVDWTTPRRVLHSSTGFSSPGNLLFIKNRWIMVLQTYPIPWGRLYANDSARLWIIESQDLIHWSVPRMLVPNGAQVRWSHSHRQIDPYLVEFNDEFYCFYKTGGQLGLLRSSDLVNWNEALQDRPVFAASQTPDRVSIENPCIIKKNNQFLMFFSPCRPGRGIGVAFSEYLLNWTDAQYLDFPVFPWAYGGPTAPMVIDLMQQTGHYLMAFHGDRKPPHGAALGMVWSRDLFKWSSS
jgi:predicted GH43/DUF377 family glycosyl hydrolase